MTAKTEELLYFLLWGVDTLCNPTFQNLTDSFEGWAYRNGYHRQLNRLCQREFLERQPNNTTAQRILRLSEKGRLKALGGRDPEAWWNRPWDEQWVLVLYDIPQRHAKARKMLLRYLVANYFGRVQKSALLSPDGIDQVVRWLSARGHEVRSFITLKVVPASGEPTHTLVRNAWDFNRINKLYESHSEILKQIPSRRAAGWGGREQLLAWGRKERASWKAIMDLDPLLPEALLPKGYLGRKIWKDRVRVLGQARGLV